MAWVARNASVSPSEYHGRPLSRLEWRAFGEAVADLIRDEQQSQSDAFERAREPKPEL